MIIKGIVKSVSNKGDKYGVNVEGTWYNGFGKTNCVKGENVEIDY